MRQVNIKELKKNLCKELQDLPFEITKYGRVVGVVGEKGSHLGEKGSHLDASPKKKVVTKKHDYPVAGISKIDTPWVNPLINSALAPKK